MRKIVLACFCAILEFPFFLHAQEYNFQTYTVEDGLTGSEVYAILQDSEGYMWFGSYGGGISRFDGKTFRNYTVNDGLADNRVLCFFEDSKKNIWIGTYGGGVSCFDGKTFLNYSTNNGLPSDVVYAIAEDKTGNIWISAFGKGICKFNPEKKGANNFTLYNQEKNGLPGNDLHAMICDSKGTIWVGGSAGIACTNDGVNFKKVIGENGWSPGNVWSIFEDSKNNIWAGTYGNGVSRYDGSSFITFSTKEGLNNNIIYTTSEDEEGKIWFGTDAGGANIYDGKTFRNITEKNSLSHNRVRTIYKDLDGNIWLGTEGGVNMYSGSSFVMFNKTVGLNDNKILSFLDDEESIWLGSFGGGVSKIIFSNEQEEEIKEIKNYTSADGLASDRVWKIFRDKKGTIWFGTSGGLSEFDGKKFTNYTMQAKQLPNNMIYAITETKNGDLWIGSDGGVTIKSGNTFKTFTDKDGLSFNRVRTIVEDKEGNVWLGTYSGGVTKYDPIKNTFEVFTEEEKLKNTIVYSIVMDDKGVLWFGTYGKGIIRYNPYATDTKKRFDYFNTSKGLSSDAIVLLCFDKKDDLWVGTIKGLDKIDMSEYLKTGKQKYSSYGKNEGFKGIACNQNAVLCNTKGNMWFGSVNGATRYVAVQEKKKNTGPKVYINQVKLFREETDWKKYSDSVNFKTGLPLNLSLPYSQNHITFDFSGLSFLNPKKILFRFFLKGFDKGWSPASADNVTTYANLPPGNYVFNVIARSSDGVWSNTPATFAFSIQTPFWQSIWFFVFVVLLFSGTIVGIYKVRTKKLKTAKTELEQMVKIRTEELFLQTAMLGKSNQEKELLLKEIHHRVKNNLQVISSLLNLQSHSIKDDTTLAVVRQAQVRVRSMALVHQKLYQTSNFSDIDFNDYLDQLTGYVGEMYHQEGCEVECNTTVTEKHFNIDTSIPLGLIITELLSNSYKYAFKNKKHGKINISITRADDNRFLLVYSDNGIGLPPDIVFEDSTTLGLELVSMLAKQLRGSVKTFNKEGAVFEIYFKTVANLH